jgi:hypothetical protein
MPTHNFRELLEVMPAARQQRIEAIPEELGGHATRPTAQSAANDAVATR